MILGIRYLHFNNKNINYEKAIVVIIASFIFTQSFSQKDFVEGIVLGESNAPLDYVNIGIIGTSLGTVSGAHGDFKLFFNDKIKGTDTVRFSSIGFDYQDFTVADLKSKDILTIKMEVRNTVLGEVVVLPDFLKSKTKGSKRTKTRMNVFIPSVINRIKT